MLSAFAAAFRTPDLRRKLLFTLGIIGIFRIGSVVPAPGVSYTAVQTCVDSVQDNLQGAWICLCQYGII